LDATHLPATQDCLLLQQAELLQHVSPLLQALFPQQVLPALAQKPLGDVVQQVSPALHLVFLQQTFPAEMQNGLVPVVQHCLLALHGGEHVCAFRDPGRHAVITAPNIAPPMSRITPRREVGFASSRARLSMN
jgi:hypothetical protein